jgi:HD-like signal output (HDOD) protein
MMLTSNPDAEVADLSDLIHQDQALAGNVLRIANSAAYRAGEPIVSLRQAVMQLGMGVLGEIAIAACMNDAGLRAPGYEPLRQRMLLHAFITGGFAKELARRKRRNVEAMFLCGLLHSVGRTVTLRLIADAQAGTPTKLAEAEVMPLLAAHQSEIAARVTVAWKLPLVVQVVAIHHATPDTAPEFGDETKLVALAATLASWVTHNEPAEEAAVRTLPGWADLNFYPDDVDAVLERRAVLEESAAIFMS